MPRALLLAHGDELVTPAREQGELLARRVGRSLAAHREAGAQFGQHARVDGIGLGPASGGTGKMSRLFGVDPGMADARLIQSAAQRRIVAARGLEHDEAVASRERGGQPRRRGSRVGNPPGGASRQVVNVEMKLADIDSEHVRV